MRRDVAEIRIRFKHAVCEPLNGRDRWYYREGHGKRIRLPDDPTEDEFRIRYREAEKAYAAAPDAAKNVTALPGSLRATVEAYYATDHFKGLDAETRRVRKRIYEGIFEEPLFPGSEKIIRDCPVAKFSRDMMQMLVDRKAETPEAAKTRLKAMRPVAKYAIKHKLMTVNPCHDVEVTKRQSDGHHTWTIEEIAQFEATHPIGTKARLAFAWLAFAGLRISDLSLVGRQHCRDGWLKLTLTKNRKRTPVTIEVPILPELQHVIDQSETGDLHFLQTDYGKAFSIKGLGQKVRQWCDQAGLLHCSAHGMRKAAASIAAENGATEAQLMAIFGWKDPRMASHYTKKARNRKLAGSSMHLLRADQTPNRIPQARENEIPPAGISHENRKEIKA